MIWAKFHEIKKFPSNENLCKVLLSYWKYTNFASYSRSLIFKMIKATRMGLLDWYISLFNHQGNHTSTYTILHLGCAPLVYFGRWQNRNKIFGENQSIHLRNVTDVFFDRYTSWEVKMMCSLMCSSPVMDVFFWQ